MILEIAPLPLAAPEAKPSYNILSCVSSLRFPKPTLDAADSQNDQLKVPALFGLGIPKVQRGENMPKATGMFPPKSSQIETDSIWKGTGFGNTDEYAELMKNPWNDYRKRPGTSPPHPPNIKDAYSADPRSQSKIMLKMDGTPGYSSECSNNTQHA
ncbi:hypothetical protein HOY80DRAFT_1060232 [Tuber brumale]|nr:hypothetical protein HOY80DRAFT_1060232 [Tuber brumale]